MSETRFQNESRLQNETKKLQKILIANRGEIAARIIHTLKRLNITSVALYSITDKYSPHTLLADESYCLEGRTPQETYLNIPQILEIARQAQVDAIHPGYGFLSENAEFARQCVAGNWVFIGPSANAIANMGSKAEAKNLMEAVNVPVIPGYQGIEQTPDRLLAEAKSLGFPILIKAAAGGGGKGMRRVDTEADFGDALKSAIAEAQKFFNDKRIILERYLSRPRHIEVQILSDQYGNHRHLYERDCSIQRRHQKIIEEAPANCLPDSIKYALYQTATQVAQAIDYVGAGTIEFLYDMESQDFYFMEMNTRLQVEHPVTECITGLDLVEWQIRIASGISLSELPDPLPIKGHAIEARVYAEDPQNAFLPASGPVHQLFWPQNSNELRLYSSIYAPEDISINFDPMIAKVVFHGDNRQEAAKGLALALKNTHLAGVCNNLHYLAKVCEEEDFLNDRYDTSYVSKHPDLLQLDDMHQSTPLACLVPIAEGCIKSRATGPWQTLKGWQLNATDQIVKALTIDQGDEIQLIAQNLIAPYHPNNANQKQTNDNEWLIHVSIAYSNKNAELTDKDHLSRSSLAAESSDFSQRVRLLDYRLCSDTLPYPVGSDQYDLKHLISDKPTLNRPEFAVNTVKMQVSIDGEKQTCIITEYAGNYWITDGNHTQAFKAPMRMTGSSEHTSNPFAAPMNATLVEVRVKANEAIEANQVLLVLEAMKMELPIKAFAKGRIKKVLYQVGDQVKAGMDLIELFEDS